MSEVGYLDIKGRVWHIVQSGDIEGAIAELVSLSQRQPTDAADALTLAGELARQLNIAPSTPKPGPAQLVFEGDRSQAERFFRSALEVSSDHSRALYGLASVLPERSRERVDFLRRASEKRPTYLGLLDLGDAQRSVAKDFAAAYQAYRAANQLNPREKGAYMKLADLCRRMDRPDEAAEWSAAWKARREAGKPKLQKGALQVEVDSDGWTRCPACNRRFSVRSSRVFVDGRHRCGQQLAMKPDSA